MCGGNVKLAPVVAQVEAVLAIMPSGHTMMKVRFGPEAPAQAA